MATVGEVPLSNGNEKSELPSDVNQVKGGGTMEHQESLYQQKAFQNEN